MKKPLQDVCARREFSENNIKGHVKRSSDTGNNQAHTYFVDQLIKSPRRKTEVLITQSDIAKFQPIRSSLASSPNSPIKTRNIAVEENESIKGSSRTEMRSVRSVAGFRNSQSVLSLASKNSNTDLRNLKTGENFMKSRFATQRGSDASSDFKASSGNLKLGSQLNGIETLPRETALKSIKFKRLFKQPKSIDYKAFLRNDPTKNNKRFVNTCHRRSKNSFGGGFKVKNQPEIIFLPHDMFSKRQTISQQSMRIRKIKTKNQKNRKSML